MKTGLTFGKIMYIYTDDSLFLFIDFEEFRCLVSLLEMTQDMETILRLFQALELDQHNGCKYNCLSSAYTVKPV